MTVDHVDFEVVDESSFYLLHMYSDRAKSWVGANVGEHQTLGEDIVVETRYIQDIVAAMIRDGLVVRKDGSELYIDEDGSIMKILQL
jgi:hypothetical protein